ncbi:MAG: ATP-binding cassette domain-containing protein [Methanocorpusculum sp.]|nr:ATP-binding cassette domain-containing protein [Methanocorpusculum sp.]MDD3270934.1 ATP-binding cassette domain-containing protein [Syntrophomonadaceae bacterium]MDD4562240.1 ATP-binding cassette domain-containing protein [Syntrophomonadaceae bacterium]
MIKVNNLSKSFQRKKVLHSINLELDIGVYGLLGANGAGKTTLLRCMAGLFESQQGEVLYNDEPIHKSKSFYNDLGYLPQAFGMFQELTLYEMTDYICSLRNIASNQCSSAIARALESVNLEDKARDRVKTLSGGMLRRAGIAQAILGDSKVILLDEPTAGLDPSERVRFKNTISCLKQDKMILISTHIVEDVDACCDNVIVIDEGQILFNGSCVKLKNIALNKVYQVKEADLAGIAGEKFSLKVNDKGGVVYHRVLTQDKQAFPSEEPSLEDGYMCLVRRLA